MKASLIVFAKAPVAGLAKTRLQPALGADGAAALAARLLQHALAQAVAAGLGPVELCVTPDASHPLLQAAARRHGARLAEQGEGDLGDRMHRALTRHLLSPEPGDRRHGAGGRADGATGDGASAPQAALLMGSDVPGLTADVLRQAAQALALHDAVFVPALDGGYTLVGLRRPAPACFAGMRWSHVRVMQDTRERLRQAGLRWAELPPLADIDEPADLVHLPSGWLRRT